MELIMLRTILKGICLVVLLVSMSGCLVGWYDDGSDRRRGDGYRDGHRGSGGYDRDGHRDGGDTHDHDNRR